MSVAQLSTGDCVASTSASGTDPVKGPFAVRCMWKKLVLAYRRNIFLIRLVVGFLILAQADSLAFQQQ